MNGSSDSGALAEGHNDHWVVVTDIVLDEDGEWMVRVYNPIPNKMETYEYDIFEKAFTDFGSTSDLSDGSGVWVDLPADRQDPGVFPLQ